MFVGEFADDFLDDVFKGDEAGNPTVFIDDQCQVEVLGLHLAKQVIGGFHLDGELGRTHHLVRAQFVVTFVGL